MATLFADNGRVAFEVDDDCINEVSKRRWYIGSEGYPITYLRTEDGRHQTRIHLHVFIFGPAPQGLIWDHHNGNKLDNRHDNLRAVTRQVNGRNSKLYSNNKSGVRGVWWSKGADRWVVQIDDNFGKKHHIGYFDFIEDAVEARKAAELQYWGDQR